MTTEDIELPLISERRLFRRLHRSRAPEEVVARIMRWWYHRYFDHRKGVAIKKAVVELSYDPSTRSHQARVFWSWAKLPDEWADQTLVVNPNSPPVLHVPVMN